ncbi:unnamed protein product [Victoria cruziana]
MLLKAAGMFYFLKDQRRISHNNLQLRSYVVKVLSMVNLQSAIGLNMYRPMKVKMETGCWLEMSPMRVLSHI